MRFSPGVDISCVISSAWYLELGINRRREIYPPEGYSYWGPTSSGELRSSPTFSIIFIYSFNFLFIIFLNHFILFLLLFPYYSRFNYLFPGLFIKGNYFLLYEIKNLFSMNEYHVWYLIEHKKCNFLCEWIFNYLCIYVLYVFSRFSIFSFDHNFHIFFLFLRKT